MTATCWGVLQMMENAGRNLAANAVEMRGTVGSFGEVTILLGQEPMEATGYALCGTSTTGNSGST